MLGPYTTQSEERIWWGDPVCGLFIYITSSLLSFPLIYSSWLQCCSQPPAGCEGQEQEMPYSVTPFSFYKRLSWRSDILEYCSSHGVAALTPFLNLGSGCPYFPLPSNPVCMSMQHRMSFAVDVTGLEHIGTTFLPHSSHNVSCFFRILDACIRLDTISKE